ncbi:MAG TPA: metal-dependent hydrolase [Candidatus Acidoferrum sp.]|nr:metal-dependent hydrolase [Candidatus Acidoferrum sp.]
MDPATHALTSLALARGIFPRRPWWFVLGVVLAGTIGDLDLLSSLFGPGAYLSVAHAVTHSILGIVVVITVTVVALQLLRRKTRLLQKPATTKGQEIVVLVFAATLAAVVHVLMDLCTSAGVALLWPWGGTRYAWDWLPGVDPWILALLLAGILLPELFRMVGSEIGTKETAPRGRNGAIAALVLMLVYVGARATLHGNAVALLDAHTYRGESPSRLAAFADPVSLMTWRGVVETSTQICTVSVPASESARFDPESGACVHKPENSPALAAAQQTEATKDFLRVARFSKASVGATEDGTEVAIRDVRNSAQDAKRFAVAARILLDRHGRVTRQEILWASEVSLR